MAEEIDTANKFLVAADRDGIVFMRSVPQKITNDDALLLAAYLVTMVGDEERWNAVREAVENA